MVRFFGCLTAAIAAFMLGFSTTAVAAEGDAPADVVQPFAVLNIAGVERWQENVRYVFETIQRKEISDAAEGMLGRVNDLKGLDRGRPFGLMVFLNGLTPAVVGYVPASNIEELATTMSIGPVTAKKAEGKDNQYELVGGRRTIHVKFKKDYGFIADNVELLDRNFPDPAPLVKMLSSRYDLAVSLNLEQIPEPTRKILLGVMQASIQSQLQQRDNEPKAEYRVRRASGMSNLQMLEQILQHGRNFTFGWDVAPEQKRAVLDFSLEVRPDSELAEYLQKMGSKPSAFRGLLAENAPMAMLISWQMDKTRKESFVEVLKAGQESILPSDPNEKEALPAEQLPVREAAGEFFKQIVATAGTGHLDLFFQLSEVPEGKFVLAGGMKLADADAAAGPLGDLMGLMPEKSPFSETVKGADSHDGISIHKLVPKEVRRQDRAVYGEKPAIWLAAGQEAVWFAFGGEEATPALKKLIDLAKEHKGKPATDATSDPFRMVLNVNRWKNLGGEEAANRNRSMRELFGKSFAAGNDALRIDLRPTENGARLRLEFDEGFLRLVANAIANQFDRSQL